MGKTTIAWATHSWNVSDGCTEPRGDPACAHCYARGLAARFGTKPNHPFHGVATMIEGYSRWTGVVRPRPSALAEPAKWREPRRVFVDSMADLFHELLPFDYVARVFDVMAAEPEHTFLVLTKRPERMLDFAVRGWPDRSWPSNVWAGTSVGVQRFMAPRWASLAQVPARVLFMSCEPLLEPLVLPPPIPGGRGLSWAIIGGESGREARPCDEEWIRSLVRQCREIGAAPFVKQMGTVWARGRGAADAKGEDPGEWDEDLRIREFPGAAVLKKDNDNNNKVEALSRREVRDAPSEHISQ